MKMVLAFIVGVAVGAVAALLLAPSSGEELRHQLRVEADRSRAQMEEQWRQEVQEVHDRVAKIQEEVEAARHKAGDGAA